MIEILTLENNQLSGALPSELGQLSRLVVLSISGNVLTGVLPTEICAVPSLVTLQVEMQQWAEAPFDCGECRKDSCGSL